MKIGVFSFPLIFLSDVEKLADRIGIIKNGRLFLDMDLDTLKGSVKQIQLDFKDVVPNAFDVHNLLSTRKIGNTVILTIRSYEDGILEKIKNQYDAKIKVLDMNFEDIFIELAK